VTTVHFTCELLNLKLVVLHICESVCLYPSIYIQTSEHAQREPGLQISFVIGKWKNKTTCTAIPPVSSKIYHTKSWLPHRSIRRFKPIQPRQQLNQRIKPWSTI